MLGGDKGVVDEVGAVEVFFLHVDRGDLVVVVAGVVEDLVVEIVTVGVDSDFVFVVTEVGAAALLVDGVEDVEELADTGDFVVGGKGIKLGEGDFRETRFGREITRKADGAHATAVGREVNTRGESINRGFGRKMLIITELKELLVEWRVVSEDADRVVVDFEAVGDGFDSDAFFAIVDNPVKLGSGELVREGKVAEVHLVEEGASFGDGSTLAKNPGDEFELSDIVFAVDVVEVNGVADEVKAGDAETFFVGGVVEERVVGRLVGVLGVGRVRDDVSDADHGVVRIEVAGFAEVERVITRKDDGALAVRKFVVEVTAEIGVFGFIGGCGTHAV